MEHAVLAAFAATVGTWLVTAAGAATVFLFGSADRRLMDVLLGFSAGVMIAASFWSLLLPAVERAEHFAAGAVTAGFLCGAFFVYAADKAASAVKPPVGERDRRLRRVMLLIASITLHNIPEGLAVGVAFGALQHATSPEALTGAITVAVGIGLQNFPEGAAVAFPLRREGFSRRKSFLWGQASGVVEPIFGVLGAWCVAGTEKLLPLALSFAAGAMIAVSVHELIPECQCGRSSHLATAGIIAGFAVMTFLDVALS